MPFVAAELLACEMPSISKQFFLTAAQAHASAENDSKQPAESEEASFSSFSASVETEKPKLSFGEASNAACQSDDKPLKLGFGFAGDDSQKNGQTLDLLDQFFEFLTSCKGEESDDKLNAIQSGYFKRIFNVLLNHSPAQLFAYVYSDKSAISLLLKHMYQDSICEVLIKIMNFSNNSFLQEQDFTKRIQNDGEEFEAEASFSKGLDGNLRNK